MFSLITSSEFKKLKEGERSRNTLKNIDIIVEPGEVGFKMHRLNREKIF
jgi:hypothetical protein